MNHAEIKFRLYGHVQRRKLWRLAELWDLNYDAAKARLLREAETVQRINGGPTTPQALRGSCRTYLDLALGRRMGSVSGSDAPIAEQPRAYSEDMGSLTPGIRWPIGIRCTVGVKTVRPGGFPSVAPLTPRAAC
jgi:hypothetical protein